MALKRSLPPLVSDQPWLNPYADAGCYFTLIPYNPIAIAIAIKYGPGHLEGGGELGGVRPFLLLGLARLLGTAPGPGTALDLARQSTNIKLKKTSNHSTA
jgi:hypothetical protein